MQPMWLCIHSGRQLDETFENTHRGNIKEVYSVHYRLRPIESVQFRFDNFASHFEGKWHFHFLIHWVLLKLRFHENSSIHPQIFTSIFFVDNVFSSSNFDYYRDLYKTQLIRKWHFPSKWGAKLANRNWPRLMGLNL